MRNTSALRQRGFSLLEVLIILVVLCIINAIAVSALMSARDKAKQGATIADMRNISTAIEAYSVDNSLPTVATIGELATLLQPYHSKHMPTKDHWGHELSYVRSGARDYSLTSFGKDGLAGLLLTPATKKDFDRDIVVANGRFPGLP